MTAMAIGVAVQDVPTSPIEGQKTGTSGLRKKAAEFSSGNYLANWVQSSPFPARGVWQRWSSAVMVVGLTRKLLRLYQAGAGNGVGKMCVGQNGYLATPAASAVIRARKAYGGFIMSSLAQPSGPTEDWGIKFNYSSGEPDLRRSPTRSTDLP